MNRVVGASSDSSSGDHGSVMELIPYLNLNAARLQQILQGCVCVCVCVCVWRGEGGGGEGTPHFNLYNDYFILSFISSPSSLLPVQSW